MYKVYWAIFSGKLLIFLLKIKYIHPIFRMTWCRTVCTFVCKFYWKQSSLLIMFSQKVWFNVNLLSSFTNFRARPRGKGTICQFWNFHGFMSKKLEFWGHIFKNWAKKWEILFFKQILTAKCPKMFLA